MNRDFALLWAGQVLSQLGSQAAQVAIVLWIVEATGSARLVGLLLMLGALPLAVLGPIGGAIADRNPRRRVVIVCDLGRGVAASGTLAIIGGGEASSLEMALLASAILAAGILSALFHPALAALVPDVVPADRLPAATALTQGSGQVCGLLGQAAGGLAYTWWGATPLLLADAASFVVAASITALVREPVRPSASGREARAAAYLRDIREGWRWLWPQVELRRLLVAVAAVNLLFMPVVVLLPIYVVDILHAGQEWYGLILACVSAGSIVGMASVAKWPGHRVSTRPLLWVGVVTCLLAASGSPMTAAVLFALIGALSGRFNVRVFAWFQSSTPATLRGRVMSLVLAIASASVPLGLAAGAVTGGLRGTGVRIVILACGGLVAGAAVWGMGRGRPTAPRS